MLGYLFHPGRSALGQQKVGLRNPQFLLFLLQFHSTKVLLHIDAKVAPFVALRPRGDLAVFGPFFDEVPTFGGGTLLFSGRF